MSEKITVNLFYMGLLATIVSVFFSGMAMYQVYQKQVKSDLQVEGNMVAAVYQETDSAAAFDLFDSEQIRITLMDGEGTVLYENQADAVQMGSQLDREEVQLALTQGSGVTIRRSESFGTPDYYYAILLDNGQILRVSVSATSLTQILGQYYLLLMVLVVVLIALAVVFALLLTRRLLKPIIKLPAEMDDPNLADDPKRVYPELAPFVREIQSQRRERESMRQEFTANVTHELKTPLTSISGYAEMISTGMAKPDDVPRFAEKIRIESERMQSLVSDIIELSELDQNEAPENPEEVDLLDVAKECADQLSASAERRSVELWASGEAFVVLGEEKKLWEMIYNLVDNAIRYNRKGGWVEIQVNAGERSVTVRDNGIGIPEEHQGRVFERFYRVDKSHSRATGGTGLGLSIVKHIAEQHQARITLKSTLNVGTEITVTFPEQ
ncbi:MAG: ATP-binding protein [Oscillospiraceae bacterium]|nr:ATP-binding protein [Oscillospiraceae bacterium]